MSVSEKEISKSLNVALEKLKEKQLGLKKEKRMYDNVIEGTRTEEFQLNSRKSFLQKEVIKMEKEIEQIDRDLAFHSSSLENLIHSKEKIDAQLAEIESSISTLCQHLAQTKKVDEVETETRKDDDNVIEFLGHKLTNCFVFITPDREFLLHGKTEDYDIQYTLNLTHEQAYYFVNKVGVKCKVCF